MSEKFTKGKWAVVNKKGWIDIECNGFDVCSIYGSHNGETVPEIFPDAHLISAAPDMYEALWAMIELHQADFGCKGLDEPAIDKACAALAKARGES